MSSGLAQRRILIVEDEAVVAMLVEEFLETFGCVVLGPAARAAQALELVAAHPIDAAVLDVNLAGERSYPVADELRTRGIPFVFATGYGKDGLDPSYRQDLVIQKPFTQETLRNALEAALKCPDGK